MISDDNSLARNNKGAPGNDLFPSYLLSYPVFGKVDIREALSRFREGKVALHFSLHP